MTQPGNEPEKLDILALLEETAQCYPATNPTITTAAPAQSQFQPATAQPQQPQNYYTAALNAPKKKSNLRFNLIVTFLLIVGSVMMFFQLSGTFSQALFNPASYTYYSDTDQLFKAEKGERVKFRYTIIPQRDGQPLATGSFTISNSNFRGLDITVNCNGNQPIANKTAWYYGVVTSINDPVVRLDHIES